MSTLRKYQLRATIVGHFGVLVLLAGGVFGSDRALYTGGAMVLVSLLAVVLLWMVMWRRGE